MSATARKMISDYLHKADGTNASYTRRKKDSSAENECAEEEKTSIDEEIIVETSKNAVGNGAGIIITATTTTGCIFGGSSLGERVCLHSRTKQAKN